MKEGDDCRRTVIRRAAFVAFLVAWPVAVAWGKRRFPNEAGIHGIPAVLSLVVYVACAAALRSRVIAGLLGGVLIWAITYPLPSFADPAYVQEWHGRLFLWSVIGFIAGLGWEGIHNRKLPPDTPNGTSPDPPSR